MSWGWCVDLRETTKWEGFETYTIGYGVYGETGKWTPNAVGVSRMKNRQEVFRERRKGL